MSKQRTLGWTIGGLILFALYKSGDETRSPPASKPPATDQANVAPTTRPPQSREQPPRPFNSSPPAPVTPPPVVTEPAPSQRLFTTANVRIRAASSTSAAIVWTAPTGSEVRSLGQEGQWHQVKVGPYEGWIHGDFLTEDRPVARENRPAPPAPLARSVPMRRTGEPARDPYVGRCDCPYDLMRNGRRCGGRSAYGRPGGRSPQCFL